MKATLDIPDDLYRRVKARSALEGRPIRSVAIQLFQDWLAAPAPPPDIDPADDGSLSEADFERFPWLRISRRYIQPGISHDMDEIREAIARGWGEEVAEKLHLPESQS
jgi:hypothetical protein